MSPTKKKKTLLRLCSCLLSHKDSRLSHSMPPQQSSSLEQLSRATAPLFLHGSNAGVFHGTTRTVHTQRQAPTSNAHYFLGLAHRAQSMSEPPASATAPKWQAPAPLSRVATGLARSNVVMSREKRSEESSTKRNSLAHVAVGDDGGLSSSPHAPASGTPPLPSAAHPWVQSQSPDAGPTLRVAPTMHRRSRSAGSMKVLAREGLVCRVCLTFSHFIRPLRAWQTLPKGLSS